MMQQPRARIRVVSMLAVCGLILLATKAYAFTPSNELEIHYINVGQGGATLIIGPNGTRILYDFGNKGGDRDIVPYLRNQARIAPDDGLHYAIVSHRDRDHYMGYRDMIEAGYDVWVANYGSGSEKESSLATQFWLEPAKQTTAGVVRPIPVGLRLSLGDGAELIVVAANGRVWNEDPIEAPNENDRSIVLFIHYGDFQYLLDGDLGGGPENCTEHDTHQKDLQTRIAQSLIDNEFMDPIFGLDVMHVAHHGSESSTSAAYYNLVRPEVAVISVGQNQGTFLHPRVDVVDKVLLGSQRSDCVHAPAVACVFQTDDGVDGESSTGRTSFTGLSVGNIQIRTNGLTGYTITADGDVHGGVSEVGDTSGRCGTHRTTDPETKWSFPFDE